MSDPQTASNENSDLITKVIEMLPTNGITEKVAEVTVKDPGLQGEGFASQAKYVTVTFENPDVKHLNLFAKVVSNNESQLVIMDEVKAFDKEAVFLTKYVPAAQRIWKAKGCQGSLDLFPKCYYGDNRMIVMENLVLDKGYCLINKVTRQNLEESKFSLRTLATHHAVSYAMIQEERGPENFFKRFPYLDLEVFHHPQYPLIMGPMYMNSLNTNVGILENSSISGTDEALSFLKEFQKKSVFDVVLKNLNYDKDELLILNHGDYWNNNMMFLKDENTNKIIGHKAIDLQITRYNTPALDLSYYMFTSVQTDVRIAHLKELLETYLDTLKKVANDLGHPIHLTYEQLFLQFQKRISFGFWWAICIVVGPGVQAMKDLDMNTVDVDDWPTVFESLIKKWIVANPEYVKVIAEELVKMIREYKVISDVPK